MNQHQQACEQEHQQATETAALTEQVQIQLSDAEFEHLQQLVSTRAVADRECPAVPHPQLP